MVPFDARLVLILPEPIDASWREALTQLLRIGREQVMGHLDGGADAWRASGREVRANATATVKDLAEVYEAEGGSRVVDVRQRDEWDEGHVPGSRHVFLGDLAKRMADVPRDGDAIVVCRSGNRASIAASLLDRAGIRAVPVTEGGVPDWLAARRGP